MCFGNAKSAQSSPKHWTDFEKRLADLSPQQRRLVADAIHELGKDIIDLDFHRALGLLDAADLLRRAK